MHTRTRHFSFLSAPVLHTAWTQADGKGGRKKAQDAEDEGEGDEGAGVEEEEGGDEGEVRLMLACVI